MSYWGSEGERCGELNEYTDEEGYDEQEEQILCSTLLPVVCEHWNILDDCGLEACSKYNFGWNTWNGENGCEIMGEMGYSPYEEEEEL